MSRLPAAAAAADAAPAPALVALVAAAVVVAWRAFASVAVSLPPVG